jgi:RimJ/RimL family protein N-acetyltransferase
MEPIETARLRLRPHSPADLLALIDGVAELEKRIGMRVADGLRDFLVSGDVSPAWIERLRESAATPADPWVHGFGVIHRESGAMMGTTGFRGPPDDDGVVEIGYGIVPAYEGHGYATEAAAALVTFAFDHDAVRLVRAHTLPEANASTRVLGKNGFTFSGPVEDPEDGLVWRWERPRELGDLP